MFFLALLRTAAVLLQHTWPSRLSTCGRHVTTAAAEPRCKLLCDSHRQCFCVIYQVYDVFAFCMYQVCVRGVCAVTKSKPKSVRRSSTAAAQPQEPYLKLLPLCQQLRCICVVGGQQEIEPRQQQFHVQCDNQTHIVGPHTRHTKHTAVAKAVARVWSRFLTIFVFVKNGPHTTYDAPGILRSIKLTPSRTGTLHYTRIYIVIHSTPESGEQRRRPAPPAWSPAAR